MSAASSTVIANMALSHLGSRQSIANLSESTTEARVCNVWYDHSRVLMLEGFDWAFARKRVALVADAEDPPTGVWGYRYGYPSDCLKARELEHPSYVTPSSTTNYQYSLFKPDAVPFDIEMDATGVRKTILTDLQDAVLVYTSDVTTTTLFPLFFVYALSYLLASNVAFTITGNREDKERAYTMYMETLNMARAHDANEQIGRKPRDADWIRARS